MSYDPNGDALSSNNYINKYTKPKKEMPRSIIFTVLLAVIVIGLVCAGTDPSNPKKLAPGAKANVHVADDDSGSEKPEATCYYEPTIVDKAGVLKEPDKLMATFNELYDLSGVCPVFVSVYDEDWAKAGYADFSKYAAIVATVIFAIVITILAVKYRNDNKTVKTEAPRNDSRFK